MNDYAIYMYMYMYMLKLLLTFINIVYKCTCRHTCICILQMLFLTCYKCVIICIDYNNENKYVACTLFSCCRVMFYLFRYAVHNTGIGFTLKKVGTILDFFYYFYIQFGESVVDVRTLPDSSDIENIGAVFGQAISK